MSARREKRRASDGTVGFYWRVDFVFRFPDGHRKRIRRWSPVQNKKGSEKHERDLRDCLVNGGEELLKSKYGDDQPKVEFAKKAEPVTLKQFEAKFLSVCKVHRNKPSELASKEGILRNHLVPAFGTTSLREIDTAAVEDYKEAKSAKNLSPKTINNHLAVLGRLLRMARKRGVILVVPDLTPIRVTKHDSDFLSFTEAPKLVESAEGQLKTMVQVILHTGLRIGEVRALRWEDVNLEGGRLRIRRNDWYGIEESPKSGRTRNLPLNAEIHQALRQHHHQRSAYVLCDKAGLKLTHNAYVKPLWSACKRAGLRKITWHVLRHTFASHLAMRGVPMRAIADLMGHSTTYVTELYSHLSPEVQRQAVEVLAWPANGLGIKTERGSVVSS